MVDRARALPSWMGQKKEKPKETESSKSRKRGKRVARATFYCMNETELVEAAVSYLTSGACGAFSPVTDRQVAEDKEVDTIVRIRETPANSKKMTESVTEAVEEPAESDDQDRTYISETDLDIVEMETIPYTGSSEHQRSEGQRSASAQDHSGLVNVGPEAEKTDQRPQAPAATADEDDAFRLVREIFFT